MNDTNQASTQPAGGPRVVARNDHPISRANISSNALKVLYRLRDSGFQAFLVGGAVRDLLLDLHPKDFDIATNAIDSTQTPRTRRGPRRRVRVVVPIRCAPPGT